jgi:diguanylate cyclase (GGDEF)-like protein
MKVVGKRRMERNNYNREPCFKWTLAAVLVAHASAALAGQAGAEPAPLQGVFLTALLGAISLEAVVIGALVWLLLRRGALTLSVIRERDALALRMAERTEELRLSNEKLASLILTDGLTGVANRRCFDQSLAREWSRASRIGQSLALAMIDVDWFKNFNDRYGHLAGDECLRSVAQLLKTAVRRDTDLAARYGGEEFALLCPGTDVDALTRQAQALCGLLAQSAARNEASPYGRVTVSIGVAALVPQEGQSPELLIELADKALYQAKRLGRNQVAVARKEALA